jgi:hypothetical protein
MNPFPDDYELITIFESEPKLLDKEIPWFYNTLFFELQRNDDVLSCVLCPAYKTISIGLTVMGRIIYDLGFENVKGINIERNKRIEGIIVEMNDDSPFSTLFIQTKPSITIITRHDENYRK